MIYSVWKPAQEQYQYYQTLGNDVKQPMPGHLRCCDPRGVVPEAAAWPLPADAKLIGAGPRAKGMIATVDRALALGDFSLDSSWVVIGGLIAAAYGLYKVLFTKGH
jgi:hypothetical protein